MDTKALSFLSFSLFLYGSCPMALEETFKMAAVFERRKIGCFLTNMGWFVGVGYKADSNVRVDSRKTQPTAKTFDSSERKSAQELSPVAAGEQLVKSILYKM